MATKKTTGSKARRTRFSAEFKQQALLRSVTDEVPVVARELGLEAAQLCAWRSKAQQQGQNDEAQRVQQSKLARLRRELVRVEEENAFLKKTAAYFAKQPKLSTRP